MNEVLFRDDGRMMFWKGQRHDLVGRKPYTRIDGSQTELQVWKTHCPVCAEPVEITTALKVTGSPSRNCDRHKRGRRVPAALSSKDLAA